MIGRQPHSGDEIGTAELSVYGVGVGASIPQVHPAAGKRHTSRVLQ